MLATLALAGISLLPLQALCQPAPVRLPEQLRFEQPDPLRFPGHTVFTGAYQDEWGFMWLGTEAGLYRYDGYERRGFFAHPENPDGLHSDNLYGIDGAPGRPMWLNVGHRALVRFDGATERARRVALPDGVHEIAAIAVAADETAWLAAGPAGLLHYSGDRFDRVSLSEEVQAEVRDVFAGAEGVIWAASRNHGVARIESGAPPRWFGAGEGLAGDTLSFATAWPDTGPFVRTERGLFEWDATTESFELVAPDDALAPRGDANGGIYVDQLGVAWSWGARRPGLHAVDLRTGVQRRFEPDPTDPNGLPDSRVSLVFEDRSGLLWIGTGQGLRRVARRDGPFDIFATPEASIATLLDVDRGGRLLGAGLCGGLSIFEEGRFRPHPMVPSDFRACALNVHQARDGALWVNTVPMEDEGGLYRIDPDGQVRRFLPDAERPGAIAHAMSRTTVEDADGNVWVGTENGLHRYDPATATFVRFGHAPSDSLSLASDIVMTLAPAEGGRLWVGHYQGGLDLFDPRTGRVVRHVGSVPEDPHTLASSTVTVVLPSAVWPHTVWVGTWEGGLDRLDTRSGDVQRYGRRHGLTVVGIMSLLEDRQGRVWIGQSSGLSVFDPARESVRMFDQGDGLPATIFGLGGAAALPDGQLAFFTEGYLVRFDPEQVGTSAPPPTVMTSYETNGVKHAVAGRPAALHAAPDEDVFAFEFAALEFAAPEGIRYRYRLDGFDDVWNESGARRYAAYTAVPPGSYTLRVEADAGGGWGGELAVPVVVEPHWYETGLARGLAILLLLGGLGAVVREASQRRLREQLRKAELAARVQAERQRISRDLHDHVGAELAEMLTEVEVARLSKDHGAMTGIETRTRATMVALRESIWAVQHERITARDLTERLERFASARARRIGMTVRARTSGQADRALLPRQALELYRIGQEAVQNAVRHSGGSILEVVVRAEPERIVVEVEDDGTRPELVTARGDGAPSSFGLGNMRTRAEALGGSLCVTWGTTERPGTRVTAEVPAFAPDDAPVRRAS